MRSTMKYEQISPKMQSNLVTMGDHIHYRWLSNSDCHARRLTSTICRQIFAQFVASVFPILAGLYRSVVLVKLQQAYNGFALRTPLPTSCNIGSSVYELKFLVRFQNIKTEEKGGRRGIEFREAITGRDRTRRRIHLLESNRLESRSGELAKSSRAIPCRLDFFDLTYFPVARDFQPEFEEESLLPLVGWFLFTWSSELVRLLFGHKKFELPLERTAEGRGFEKLAIWEQEPRTLLIAASLAGALSKVSANAAPGLVDALLLTTQCPPSSLLLGLLEHFPDVYKRGVGEAGAGPVKREVDLYRAYLAAVLHLLRNRESEQEDLLKVLWTVYIPVLRSREPDLSIFQIEVAEMLADATSVRNDWEAVKESLVPLCLNSLYPSSLLIRENASADGLRYIVYSGWRRLEKLYNVISTRIAVNLQDELFSFYAATQLVAILLGSALEATSLTMHEMKSNADTSAPRRFSEDMISVFFAPALVALAQPLDDSLRRYAMQNLLPPLLKSAARYGWLHDVSPEKRIVETRISPTQEVWLSCRALLSHGSSHRRDAYMAIALFSDFLLPSELTPSRTESSTIKPSGDFDVRDQIEFWEVLKMGLGDADTLTRKRALHVFKKALRSVDLSTGASQNIAGHAASSGRDLPAKSSGKNPKVSVSTKRNKWAEEEAASLGVAAVKDKMSQVEGWSQRWDAFILLHETLEEYGIHLVEAAWSHQMTLLLQFTKSKGDAKDSAPYWAGAWSQKKPSSVDVNFTWIAVLWQRGFDHTNPQVRRLVMQSFLEFDWERIRKLSSLLPEGFVLGSLIQALDDPVQHRDFGMKGIYSSATTVGAGKFMSAYSASLPPRRHIGFVVRLAKGLLSQSRTRPGLMTLALCLEAAALGSSSGKLRPVLQGREHILPIHDAEMLNGEDGPIVMLELLKNVVENSKRHFNPKYREKVCGHVLKTAAALLVLPNVPFSRFAFFLSSFPRDLLMHSGSLHSQLMAWTFPAETITALGSNSDVDKWVLEGLHVMLELYLKPHGPISSPITDEDVEAWRLEAGRWARLLLFGLVGGDNVLEILLLIEQHALQFYNYGHMATCTSLKVLLLIQSLFKEWTLPSDFPPSTTELSADGGKINKLLEAEGKTLQTLITGISNLVLSIMVELNDFARRSAAIFWEHYSDPVVLPASVSGKLGGPSQRRLPSSLTSAVLQGVLSVSTVADCCLWCCSAGCKLDIPESVLNFLWQFAWEATTTPNIMTELTAELQLGAYEALTSVCHALSTTMHPFFVTAGHASVMRERTLRALLPNKAELMVDGLINALLSNASAFAGALARSRRAVLAAYKWSCLDSLLSITKSAVSGRLKDQNLSAASNSVLDMVFQDSIESLESAGEEYILPLLRCIRWLMQWGILGQMDTDDDPDKKYQVMWTLVQSGWSTMADCNKRKVAPTAAFLSAIFHPAIFGDHEMHRSVEDADEHGPLKWLLNRLIDQGSRSPRTMRLTALHITGLWLMFPGTTVFYMPELKKLALHGGESVDEELDGEIIESQISAREYATLIESSDPELTEEFTNSEMYVRVMVAVMVHKLANLVEDQEVKDDVGMVMRIQAGNFGRMFLLQLLNAAATDTDLSKELYKKKSAIHRRKVRVWQLLCILSRFLGADNVAEVTSLLKICLYKNNIPSVRQYIEAFAIKFFLQFPHLVEESLIPVLNDYNMKTQALSSYVLIAANVLMFTQTSQQKLLLQQVLPAILPFMTSHHHSLRSFTQVLIYKILQRFSKSEGLFNISQGTVAGGQCLRTISNYLEGNADCTRLRISIEKHVDAFDPVSMTTPRGLFCSSKGEVDPSRSAEDHPFECVPFAVLDQVAHFLIGAREELRESMAADANALNAERFSSLNGEDGEEPHMNGRLNTIQGQSNLGVSSMDISNLGSDLASKVGSLVRDENDSFPIGNSNIQKKIASLRFNDANAAYDVEEELLLTSIESRAKELIRMRGDRQDLIVVASLLGRVPNLAGLARTCEVFKASSLVVADASIADDRQFQLISVTADQWIPLVGVPEAALNTYLNLKRKEGYSVLGLEQTANSVSIDKFEFPDKVVLVLGRESDGIPVDVIQALDSCVEIPQLGVIRSLNVHVSGAIAIWEYTRQHLNSRNQRDGGDQSP